MSAQTIVTPSGERLVMLPEAEYEALIAAAEDAADCLAVREFRRDLAEGREELIPAAVVDRILAGESRIRVWREHRGYTLETLAARIGVDRPVLLEFEAGGREMPVETLRMIADALSLNSDDLVG